MSKITNQQLEVIVTKAALDPAYRERLAADPVQAMKTLIEYDDEDLNLLAALSADLQRIGANQLHPTDAKAWAIGICHIHVQFSGPGSRRER